MKVKGKNKINIHDLRDLLKMKVCEAIEEFEKETAIYVMEIEIIHNSRIRNKYKTNVGAWIYPVTDIEMQIELKEDRC